MMLQWHSMARQDVESLIKFEVLIEKHEKHSLGMLLIVRQSFIEMCNLLKNIKSYKDFSPLQLFVPLKGKVSFYKEEAIKMKNSQYLINSSNSFAPHSFWFLLFSITFFFFFFIAGGKFIARQLQCIPQRHCCCYKIRAGGHQHSQQQLLRYVCFCPVTVFISINISMGGALLIGPFSHLIFCLCHDFVRNVICRIR